MRPGCLLHRQWSMVTAAATWWGLVVAICAAVTPAPCDKTRRVFAEPFGVITDGPTGSNYTKDSHCEWLIRAQNSSQFITLSFRSMGTECSYDYVFVYDGDSFRSPLLGSFSGKTEPQQVVASSGNMLILLYSDTNYVLDGFRAEFTVSNCPSNCSDHGVCAGHSCVCIGDWGGRDCSRELCPNQCGLHGKCRDGSCQCTPGYSGQDCSLHNVDPLGNIWHWLSHSESGLAPRAAHTAVYVNDTDSLYVFGGYDLNKVLGSLEIYRFNTSTWIDEWGNELNGMPSLDAFDRNVLKAILSPDGIGGERLGLKSQASIFSSVLYSFSDNATLRRQRSTEKYNFTVEDDLNSNSTRPSARYGHAACRVPGGFAIYGGKLDDGNLSNELWLFNVTSGQWSTRGDNDNRPPPLTRHTLTLGGRDLYLFGGSTEDGEFSSRLYRIRLSLDGDLEHEAWTELRPRGGKELDVRVVAHTTVYHSPSNSLIIYGGVVAGVARFSKLSDRMFAFQLDSRHWAELQYPRAHLRDTYVPRERAFHSTTIIGNYLIVFGGYSHRHNKEEICYDNQMYLYHLGCHAWVNPDMLGRVQDSRYPKQQGVFAHAADIRYGSTLLIVGGYHGNVNGDLFAYTLPPMLAVKEGEQFDPEATCPRHHGHTECLADPECGWCSADEVCYGRTIGANCTTNLQTTRCPGICPALGDCHACLVHGAPATLPQTPSVASKLGLGQCTWCVQNARCHHKDDNYGVCGEVTPSQVPGWWGSKGTEVLKPEQCRELDKRPGLTFLKYQHPVNWSQPDHVTIINATTVDFNGATSASSRTEHTLVGEMVARLRGFIRPPPNWQSTGEILKVCASYSHALLKLSNPKDSLTITANISAEQSQCELVKWPYLEPVRLMVDFEARKVVTSTTFDPHQSKMELQHTANESKTEVKVPKVFTFEYLEPYSEGYCNNYDNCLHCLTDSLCGWCELNNRCLPRSEDESQTCVAGRDWRYLTLEPSACANCSNYISCDRCLDSGLCEWWIEDAVCARKGRARGAVVLKEECPGPCHARKNCSACLDERGRCVWCEATQQCFSFSVYTSEYQFGLCREWLDQAVPLPLSSQLNDIIPRRTEQCKSCGRHSNCSTCLHSLSCGWCYSPENPIQGVCMQGDFNRPHGDCSVALNITAEESQWAYAQCPDVDECGLGLHDCHKEAFCTNTHGSYSCQCKRGFEGDGRTSCIRTCYNNCIHGYCKGAPNYTCQCDLGWVGVDCSTNCGCHNHSTCVTKVGVCDECQDWTEGLFCERCKAGSYGNATSSQGCKQCECNGHGNKEEGVCDLQSGECYCQDNTEGSNCEKCNKNFYGDPRNGGQCYYHCESRGMLSGEIKQGIGSYQPHQYSWGGPPARECLWVISPHTSSGALSTNSILQLTINQAELNVSCGDNAVYVYDGLPDLGGSGQQSQLLGVFCSQDATPPLVVEARSGHLTVHYKQGERGQGFNAIYEVLSCERQCPPSHICKNNYCVCKEGFAGPKCAYEICPNNCSALLQQGSCDRGYGRCLCSAEFGGPDCSEKLEPYHVVFTELFNSQYLADSLDHLRKTLPRFGHSLVADRRRSLWMFGGYSLSHGPLNDIRLFDTRNNTWMQVTVEATPEAKMPQGRYFHAAEFVHSKQAIYIFGGLTTTEKGFSNNTLGDFWQFSLQNQRWEALSETDLKPPPLTGHTLTLVKDEDSESLLIIGGYCSNLGFLSDIWEYDLTNKKWVTLKAKGAGPVGVFGHSSVYHAPTRSLYVFGGYEYIMNKTVLSNKLYALHISEDNELTWSELPVFPELNNPKEQLPRARFLHSAITTENYMVVFGGRTQPHNASDALVAYIYSCNKWIRLVNDVEVVGSPPPPTYAHAMTVDPDSKYLYIVGGWDGGAHSHVTRVELPSDICTLWSNIGKHSCRQIMGCSFCKISLMGSNSTHCFSTGNSEVCSPHNSISTNNGLTCDDNWFAQRSCSNFTTCTACLATWPSHPETHPICKWCAGCGRGRCIPLSVDCDLDSKCGNRQKTTDAQNIVEVDECPERQCPASDCEKCYEIGSCTWTQNVLITSEYGIKVDANPISDWNCVSKEIKEKSALKVKDFGTCPLRCNMHKNCSTCLSAAGAEGGWHECRWSTQLNECISPSYQPLYCAGGVCGLVLRSYDVKYCPEPCESFTQCSVCLRHAHCGWCSRNGGEGEGICAEGSLDSPMEYPASSTCDVLYADRNKLEAINPNDTFAWNYIKCPPENECLNGHHNCDPRSEQCVDLEEDYKCECGAGYKSDGDSCIPVCSQGCVRGTCVQPDECICDFGYVGANCSIQCQCNGHANCEGPDKLDQCLKCHNNTMGAQCEKCKPLFVGDPSNNGVCVPCIEYCNGHSSVCMADNTGLALPPLGMSLPDLEDYLKEGPIGPAKCLRCENNTTGQQCEECIVGMFRGSDDHTDPCRPCQCHGHGDTCDPVTGEKCNCGNNTESDATCHAGSKNSANAQQQCWKVQCSKCRDSYVGTPTDGHQCYKLISVNDRMCFDAKKIDECKMKPKPLNPGQTVFFVVQPRYMNVNIHIIIDVTQGALDLFLSPRDNTFVVSTNSTGAHHVDVDPNYKWQEEETAHVVEYSSIKENVTGDKLHWTSSTTNTVFNLVDQHAKDLSTYITIEKRNFVLRVYGLKNRLVLILPQDVHYLNNTRFYLALRAVHSEESPGRPSYGMVFTRQDQLHIDLFVFFSVFFSCFFLFLSACVVAWKAKQAADVRRARRRHVVEMLHMAKRPFATATLLLGPNTPIPQRRGKPRKLYSGDVRPVAIEPTDDGVAAVGTVFVRLPGGQKTPVRLALASSLIMLSRQYPTGGRAFLRRRSSHHGGQVI